MNRIYCKICVSDYDMSFANDPASSVEQMAHRAMHMIGEDLISKNMLSWDVQKNMMTMATDYIFKLGVVKL
jgi:hypothetical protein